MVTMEEWGKMSLSEKLFEDKTIIQFFIACVLLGGVALLYYVLNYVIP